MSTPGTGSYNGNIFASNADFSQDPTIGQAANILSTDGQFWIGSTALNGGGTHVNVGKIVSAGGTVSVTYVSPNINLEISGGSAAVEHLTGNSGGQLNPTANNFNIITAHSTPKFVGSGSTLTLDFALTNLVLGSALPALTSATLNVGVGFEALKAVTSSSANTAIGYHSLQALAGGSGGNTAVGENSLLNATTGAGNTALGIAALSALLTTSNNTAVGANALASNGGTSNIGIGSGAGSAYTGTESSNILIGNAGVIGESNVTRIGTQGSGTGQQTLCYLAGVLTTTSGRVRNVTTPGAYPYTTLITDDFIKVDTSAARTIVPMAAPVTGTTYIIKDTVGTAATFNITITPSGKNIDGAASHVINVNYGSVTIVYNSAEWSII